MSKRGFISEDHKNDTSLKRTRHTKRLTFSPIEFNATKRAMDFEDSDTDDYSIDSTHNETIQNIIQSEKSPIGILRCRCNAKTDVGPCNKLLHTAETAKRHIHDSHLLSKFK